MAQIGASAYGAVCSGGNPYTALNNGYIKDSILTVSPGHGYTMDSMNTYPLYTNLDITALTPKGKDPKFVNYGKCNFKLKDAAAYPSDPSPYLTAGSDGTQLGAYGGPGASGWNDGCGADTAKTGSNLP